MPKSVSFLSASAHPRVSPAMLLSPSPQILVLPVSPCCLSFSLTLLALSLSLRLILISLY